MQEFIEDMQSVIKIDVIKQMHKFIQAIYREMEEWGDSIDDNCENELRSTLATEIMEIIFRISLSADNNISNHFVTKEKAYEFLFQMTEIASSLFDVEKVLLYDDIIEKKKNPLTEYVYLRIYGLAIAVSNQ